MYVRSVLNRVKSCDNLGFLTYTQIYNSCVCPVSNNASGVWVSKNTQAPTLFITELFTPFWESIIFSNLWRYGSGISKHQT